MLGTMSARMNMYRRESTRKVARGGAWEAYGGGGWEEMPHIVAFTEVAQRGGGTHGEQAVAAAAKEARQGGDTARPPHLRTRRAQRPEEAAGDGCAAIS